MLFREIRSHLVLNLRVFALLAVALALFALPGSANAATSPFCPAQSLTVTQGGSVTSSNLSTCDGPSDIGMAPVAPNGNPFNTAHGTVTLNPGIIGGNQFVVYVHNGDSATSDTFQLEDENGDTLTFNVTITPVASPITVTPASLSAMTAGTAFSQTLSSTGGTGPYIYTLQSGTLPVGLTLSSGGTISGTPTQRGNYTFTIRSTDSIAQFADKSYSGTVANPSLALAAASATAIQSVPFSTTLATNGGVAPYTYQLETGSLPAGLTLSAAGVISGTTTAAAGSYPVTIRVTESSTGVGSYFEVENFSVTVSPPPSVSIAISPASVSEDGATNLTYTVTRSLNLSSATTVNITTAGTATAGTDYTGNVSSVTIPAGSTTATITIDPTVDGTVEPDETVTLIVAAGSGYTVGAPSSATGTILNDDVPTATISVSPANVAEDGAPNLVYTVTLNQAAFNPIQVNYVVSGTATNGTDYAAITSPVLINTGLTTATITVNPTADATIESDETVTLSLAAGTGYTVGVPNAATGTILNDDLPNMAINDVTAVEGNAGTSNFTFTVSLSAPAGPGGVSFDIATANGTATSGTDYTATSLTSQTIPAGSSSYTFTVPVLGDVLNEPTETFFVNVTNVVNAVVVDGQGVGTIANDDPLPSLSINDVTVTEGNAGTTNAVFTVTLSAASGQTVTVNYATADGTAVASPDYTNTSGSLTFTPGQTTRTITVPVVGETVPEANETFFVNLAGATNATIADNQGLGTITNDDVPVTITPASLPSAQAASPYSQTLTASGGTGPYSFAVTAGALPSGLTLSSGGVLAGTPTVSGPFNFTVTATDSSGAPGPFSGSQAYSLTVTVPTITLPAKVMAGGTVSAPYSDSLTGASGGASPYSYAVSAGALPAGLTLNATTAAITGTPTAGGTFSFTVTASDSSGAPGPFTGSQSYSIAIASPTITLPAKTLAGGNVGQSYTDSLNPASGGTAPYSYAVTGGALPGGLTLNAASGAISGTPTAGGTFNFTVTATDSSTGTGPFSAAQSYSIAVLAAPIASASSLTVAYDAPATNVPLSLSGGAASSLAITTAPAHGTASVSGLTITYQPTAGYAGADSFAYTASNASGTSAPASVTVTVNDPVISIAASSGLSAAVGTPYSNTFTWTGGAQPFSGYQVTGLPIGLSITGTTSNSVTISGTPNQAGTFSLNVSATDASTGNGPFTVGQAFSLTVAAPTITLSPGASTLNAPYGAPFSQTFTAAGGTGPYSYAVSGSLPAGITFNTSSGVLSGTPTAPGSYAITVTATDTGSTGVGAPFTASNAYTLSVPAPTVTITPTTLPGGTAAAPYSQQLSAAGGIAPYSYTVTAGALPAGLTLSTAGLISGTPTASGNFAFTVTAADANAQAGSQAYSLAISAPSLTITPATLPAARFGIAYNQTLTASGGIAPYHFAVTAGALPTGLTLNPTTGLLSGTPTASGTFNVTITVTDSTAGTAGSGSRSYALSVIARPDPAADPEVRGLVQAQAAIARRVADVQITNFHQRLEALHNPDASGFSNGLRLAPTTSLCRDIQIQRSTPACSFDGRGPTLSAADENSGGGASANSQSNGRTGIWTAGIVRFGERDGTSGQPSYSFATQGLSMGMDYRFSDGLTAGLGLGLSHERQDVGDNGSGINANSKSVVAYASHRIAPKIFVDWLTGYQWIDFGIKRYVTSTSAIVESNRKGHQWFASLSAMADLDEENWRFAPYLRLDLTRGNLAAYTESSGSLFDLRFLDQRVDYTVLSLGARYERHLAIKQGRLSPLLRLEYQRDLQGDSLARVGYADQAASQFSTITLNGFNRDRFLIGLGGELILTSGWGIEAEYAYRTGSDSLGDNSIRFGIKGRF